MAASVMWRNRLVEPADDQARGFTVVPGEGAQHVADLGHARGGVEVVAGDIADDERYGPVGQKESVVPVPTDLRGIGGRLIAGDHTHARHVGQLGQEVALHRLGDRTLALVEPGVGERQPGPPGDVLQQGEVVRSEGVRPFAAADGQGAEDFAYAADGRDRRGMHARGVEQFALGHRNARVRWSLVVPGAGERRGRPSQCPRQRHGGILRDRRHRAFEVAAALS